MLKSRFFHIAIACLSLSLGLAACQGSREKKQTLSYEFSANGCSTGKKTFSDLASYCAGLQDDAANNGCASEMRLKTYQVKCSSIAQNAKLEEADKLKEKEAALDESMSYDFTANDCATGKKTFPDLASYCTGLKDDKANNHCATQLRMDAFKKNCTFDMKNLPEINVEADANDEKPKVENQESSDEFFDP